MAESSDPDLVRAAREGDRAALETLLERHEPRVFRFAARLCRDREDAKDVLQETLLAMARTIGDFRGASSLSTWLFTIARSFCIKKRRRSRFAPAAEQSLEALAPSERDRLADPSRGAYEQLAARRAAAALDAAIAALAPGHREVLLLRDVEGLKAKEVADVLGISVEAVKSRLHRARAALRESVAPVLGFSAEPGRPGCPEIASLFSKHLEGDLSRERCARMEKHLEGCGRCRGACESLKRTLALCREAPGPALPDEIKGSVRAALRRFLEAPRPA
jgi:RNA polymerase sigma-70 factor (ECF subfamily)